MKCQFCNSEIPDDAMFCPECGKGQEKPLDTSPAGFCPKCGCPLEAGSLFCPECGARTDAGPEMPKSEAQSAPFQAADTNQQNVSPGTIPPAPGIPQPKGKGHIVILVFLLVAFAIVALVVYGIKSVFFPSEEPDTPNIALIEDYLDDTTDPQPASGSEDNSEVDLSDVDYNLLENSDLTMEGMVKTAKSGGKVLQWKNELTFYGQNESGERILMEDATSAYIDSSILPDGFLDTVSANNHISIKGSLHFSGNDLYISPIYVYDSDGNDMVAAFLDTKSKAAGRANSSSGSGRNSDYVLPQSNSRLLGKSDISGLSLQEINYAKNEIYARHGRLFKSDELQTYFNSKSWYNGTISPDSFSESLLSDVEKKNVEYLSDIEFGMSPGGYQLDPH